MQGKKETVTHIILVGASNMRRTAQHIKDLGLRVTECPLKGGIPNDDAIDQVTTPGWFLTYWAASRFA